MVLDRQQEALLRALGEMRLAGLRAGSPVSTADLGVYVHGPVGRGKSWVTSTWFEAVPEVSKIRLHFHDFLEQVNREVFTQRQLGGAGDGLMRRTIAAMLGGAQLLYFDEFHVHDPGDGRLVSSLLEYATEHGIHLVVTSNYAPGDLMGNPAWRPQFDAARARIEAHLQIVSLTAGIDYRSQSPVVRAGFARGSWSERSSSVESAVPADTAADRLTVHGRDFEVLSATSDHLTATFGQLCEAPISTVEYLEWSRRYPVWTLCRVPHPGEMSLQAQQRLLNLIDILSDAGTVLHMEADIDREAFIAALHDAPDVARLASRLQLLRD